MRIGWVWYYDTTYIVATYPHLYFIFSFSASLVMKPKKVIFFIRRETHYFRISNLHRVPPATHENHVRKPLPLQAVVTWQHYPRLPSQVALGVGVNPGPHCKLKSHKAPTRSGQGRDPASTSHNPKATCSLTSKASVDVNIPLKLHN